MPPTAQPLSHILDALPEPWPHPLLPDIQKAVKASSRKVVVLDDDPTGTQTVHDVPVLTQWSVDVLAAELNNDRPCFYILTNSRSLPLASARALNAGIGENLVAAARATGREFVVVSRSDSTLRGHYPAETEALVAALGQTVDATLIVPFFLEGGRYTIGDVHYVAEGERLIPAGDTAFARDAAFGYRSSDLRRWVEEKTDGRVQASSVASISIDDVRLGGPQRVADILLSLPAGGVCVVNAAAYRDMEVIVAGLLAAEASGRRFLYRTAASFVRVRAGIAPRPLLTPAELDLPAQNGSLFVVGSYVPKTTRQVQTLLERTDIQPVEIDVAKLLDDAQRPKTLIRAAAEADHAIRNGRDVLLCTSRQLITGADAEQSLAIGQRVSDSLVAIVRAIDQRPRFVLAKGGITSSDVATRGLDIRRALVRGQILPGVPVWQCGAETRFPGLTYIVFPGNVGDDDALAEIAQTLRPF